MLRFAGLWNLSFVLKWANSMTSSQVACWLNWYSAALVLQRDQGFEPSTQHKDHKPQLFKAFISQMQKLSLKLIFFSYCLVVTEVNHCCEFPMPKCPINNCQIPMHKASFIESVICLVWLAIEIPLPIFVHWSSLNQPNRQELCIWGSAINKSYTI